MEPLRRTVLPILRGAIAPISTRLSNAFGPSAYSYPSYGYNVGNPAMDDGSMESDPHLSTNTQGGLTDNGFATTTNDQRSLDNSNNNHNIMDYEEDNFSSYSEPITTQDMETIQSRVSTVFDALQTEHMSAAELSLIRTVRETASDTDIMTKIVNNNSFQDFINKYVSPVVYEQRPLIEEHSTRSHRRTQLVDESESEDEYDLSYFRSANSDTASTTSTSSGYLSTDEGEITPSRRGSRARNSLESSSQRTPQEIALNRLNELCNQITPDLGLASDNGWHKESEVNRSVIEEHDPLPEGRTVLPTMEGAGVPGVPNEKDVTPPHINPVYLFMISACIIPITILAVTAAIYPSQKTIGLLKSGFKMICGRVFA